MPTNRLNLMGRTPVMAGTAFLLFVTAVGLALAAPLPPGGTFSDDDGIVHEANIEAIAADGITKGCNPPVNDLYCPDSSVTRAQMATFLTRALSLPAAGSSFSDTAGSVHEADIGALAAAGITKGCNPPVNDLYCPDSSVTRAEMATFLTRALGLTPIVPPPPTTVPPNPGDSVNCTDFATWTEAQEWFDTYYPHYGDVANLDSDGDLIACESLPGAPGKDHPQSGDGWQLLGCSSPSGTCAYPQNTVEAQVEIESKLLPPAYCVVWDPIESWRCALEWQRWEFNWFDQSGTELHVVGTGCSYQYDGGFLSSVTCYLPLAGAATGEYRGDLCSREYPSFDCVEDLFSAYFNVVP